MVAVAVHICDVYLFGICDVYHVKSEMHGLKIERSPKTFETAFKVTNTKHKPNTFTLKVTNNTYVQNAHPLKGRLKKYCPFSRPTRFFA